MYQFIHIECYAREAGKTKTGSNNVSKVIEEAARNKEFFPHIEQPKPPKHIFGIDIKEVEKEAFAWADASTDAKGRKLRKDGLCLLAGVFSIPNDLTDNQWNDYKKDAVEWLKEKYGSRLRCVVEHTDESHRHCHFYCIPLAGEKFDDIHDGKKAYSEARNKKLPKGQQNKAYKDAMRQFQEDFSILSRKYALSKIGPGKRRLTQAQYKAEKEHLKLLADMSNNKEIAINSLKEEYRKSFIVYKKRKIDQTIQKLSFIDKIKFQWHKPTAKVKGEVLTLTKLNKKLQEENEQRIVEIQQQKNLLDKKTTYFHDILKQKENEITDYKKTINKQQKQLEEIAKKFNCSVEELKDILEEDLKNQSTIARTKKRTF